MFFNYSWQISQHQIRYKIIYLISCTDVFEVSFLLSHLNRALVLDLTPFPLPPPPPSLLRSSSTSVTRHRRLTCRSRLRSPRSRWRWEKNLTMSESLQGRETASDTCWRLHHTGETLQETQVCSQTGEMMQWVSEEVLILYSTSPLLLPSSLLSKNRAEGN